MLFLSGATADNPTAMLTWDKNYTHLVGIGNPLYGMGQRCRFIAQATADLTVPLTISASGCIFKNIQINNEHASTAATGCTIVSGSRNYFEGMFWLTPTSAYAAAYSLKVAGSENLFVRCTIGQHTNVRGAASYGLWLCNAALGSCLRNKFVKCEFLSWSSVTTHALVYTDIDLVGETFTVQFEDCLFDNYNGSGEAGGVLAVAIDDNCAVFHQILLRGNNQFAACTAVADPLTYVLVSETTAATARGGLMATVNES